MSITASTIVIWTKAPKARNARIEAIATVPNRVPHADWRWRPGAVNMSKEKARALPVLTYAILLFPFKICTYHDDMRNLYQNRTDNAGAVAAANILPW